MVEINKIAEVIILKVTDNFLVKDNMSLNQSLIIGEKGGGQK